MGDGALRCGGFVHFLPDLELEPFVLEGIETLDGDQLVPVHGSVVMFAGIVNLLPTGKGQEGDRTKGGDDAKLLSEHSC